MKAVMKGRTLGKGTDMGHSEVVVVLTVPYGGDREKERRMFK